MTPRPGPSPRRPQLPGRAGPEGPYDLGHQHGHPLGASGRRPHPRCRRCLRRQRRGGRVISLTDLPDLPDITDLAYPPDLPDPALPGDPSDR